MWDITDTAKPSQITHPSPIWGHSVAFSPNRKLIATGKDDGSIILWDIAQPENPTEITTLLSENASEVTSIVFNSDGTLLVSGSLDGTVILWDISDITAPFSTVIGANRSHLSNIAFSPDGKYVAWGAKDNFSVTLWNLNPYEYPHLPNPLEIFGQGALVTSVAFNTSGTQIVSGGNNGSVILWDIHSPILSTPLQLSDSSGLPYNINFNNNSHYGTAATSDGKLKASADINGMITLLVEDEPTKASPFDTRFQRDIGALALSIDGTFLASGNNDGVILLWDITNPDIPTLLSQTFAQQAVYSLAFNLDATQLAVGAIGVIIIFDISDPSVPLTLGAFSSRPDMLYQVLEYSQDGKVLASGNGSDTVIFWDLDPESWKVKACQRAGRNFTRAEWTQYFPNEPYRKTCEQWPPDPDVTPTP